MHHTVGLKPDGTVLVAGYTSFIKRDIMVSWENIITISSGLYHAVGLKSDGTVVATGDNKHGQCDVDGWKDIVSIYCGDWYTVGIKSDGTVVAVGENEYGQCDVEDWNNIAIPISKKEYEVKQQRIREEKEAARKAKIESLEKEKATLEAELPNIKGLFAGSKKAKAEARIAEIEKELQTLR